MIDADTGSRLVYPELPVPLTDSELARLFTPTAAERDWATAVARSGPTRVALLVHLKVFGLLGRFLSVHEIPLVAVQHVADSLYETASPDFVYERRTMYRHHRLIRRRLGVTAWGVKARTVAEGAMARLAEARIDPADMINAAIDALIHRRYELPALETLRTLAGTAHRAVNSFQWQQISEKLRDGDRQALDSLLVADEETRESPFATLCRGAGKVTRDNLKLLIARYHWIRTLPEPGDLLAPVSDAKVVLWANEARRLKAPELRAYVAPRRYALLLSMLRHARGQILDDLTTMLIRLSRRVRRRAEEHLEDWHHARRDQADELIGVLSGLLAEIGADGGGADLASRLLARVESHGDVAVLQTLCETHLAHARRRWQPFAHAAFLPYRAELMALVRALPLEARGARAEELIGVTNHAADNEPPLADYYLMDVRPDLLPRDWSRIVRDDPRDRRAFNRRHLEVAAVIELADAVAAGEVHVKGSLSHDRFWHRLPAGASTPTKIEAYTAARGWKAGPAGFVVSLRDRLTTEAVRLDMAAVIRDTVELDKDGQLVIRRVQGKDTPNSATELAARIADRMPERSVLDALVNTARWVNWHRHFGLPSRLGSQIKDALRRYILTSFAYGCGLGPTQAARHFKGELSADDLRFVERRHMDTAGLRAASADIINFYAQFELTHGWGTGATVAADGTHFHTYRDNLLAEFHIRYGKTGGIAYRHVADNYIALFSHFIGCGVYEATYILDALQKNTSDVRPTEIHADSHGQSEAAFGLAYLLGIELMPRIRRWAKLRLYRPSSADTYVRIDGLFRDTIRWNLIEAQHANFLRLALSIQSGLLSPSTVLARVNSYSTRDPFAVALRELGRAVRTTFLLRWAADGEVRRRVHKGTTNVERHHHFAKHLAFGGGGLLRTNQPADQEKAIVFNELVANAVALQTVVDLTSVIHQLQSEGARIESNDLAFLSPYMTSHLKRFGDYTVDFDVDGPPPNMELPTELRRASAAA